MGNRNSKSKKQLQPKIDPISTQCLQFMDKFQRQIKLKEESIDNYHDRQRLTVFGWTRKNIININDKYNLDDIITIVISYYTQGFANYFDEAFDANYEQQLQFGDILRTKDSKYMVLDIDNMLQDIGREECLNGFGDDSYDYNVYLYSFIKCCIILFSAL